MTSWVLAHLDPFALRGMLLVAIQAFLVLTLLSFCILILHKIHVERRERFLNAKKNRYLSSWYRTFSDPSFLLDRPKRDIDFEALADTAIFLLSEEGSSDRGDRIREVVRELGVPAYFEERIGSDHRWTDRYLALEKLGFLALPEEARLYREILEKEEEELLHAKAAWGLSRIANREDLPAIDTVLSRPAFMSAKFSEYVYTNVIEAFRNRGESDLLLLHFEEMRGDTCLPSLLLRDVVEACGFCRFTEGRPYILGVLADHGEIPQIRMACLRALGQIGGEGAEERILSCLSDADTGVRAVAARSAEGCTTEATVPLLTHLLGDSSYHVRINAAASLSRLGDAGSAVLRTGIGNPDPFVRDVCRYMLEGTPND
jgi:HEAT repeat protein